MRTNDLFHLRNMQISLAVENKKRNNSNDEHDNWSPNVDSLTTKLKHKGSKQQGPHFVSPTNLDVDLIEDA